MGNPAATPPCRSESGEAVWAGEKKRSSMVWQTMVVMLANMLFSLTPVELWGQETVLIPAPGESLLVNT